MHAGKAPFPWYGGKSQAVRLVWQLLGDVDHYCEPFAGSLAVLLDRPHPCNRPYFSETVNDIDGLLVNAWRSIQFAPDATAEAASWPVMEADKSARQIALLRWRETEALERLAGDPAFHDPVMGGWWLWSVAVQIGAFLGDGAWTADRATGRIVKQARGPTRDAGVVRNRPDINDNGRGVCHAGLREPGVSRDLPLIVAQGAGVCAPQLREAGVVRDRPFLANNGQGVCAPQMREPGVCDDDEAQHYHPTTMPKLRQWFGLLSARLRHVRVLNGDWSRLCTVGASHTLPVRTGGHAGLFLDPPYATDIRANGLYAHDSGVLAAAVRAWALTAGTDPHNRIVVAGFDVEHAELQDAGWTVHEWFAADSLLRGGMGDQQHRERLWASPHCLALDADRQGNLFAAPVEDAEAIYDRRAIRAYQADGDRSARRDSPSRSRKHGRPAAAHTPNSATRAVSNGSRSRQTAIPAADAAQRKALGRQLAWYRGSPCCHSLRYAGQRSCVAGISHRPEYAFNDIAPVVSMAMLAQFLHPSIDHPFGDHNLRDRPVTRYL